MRAHLRPRQDESGIILVAALVMLVSLTAIGTFAIHMTTVNQNIAATLKASKQAFYLAEAGLQHARLFLTQNQNSWNNATATATNLNLIAPPPLSTLGTYNVTIQDVGGGARRVRSTGNTGSNATAVIEAQSTLQPGRPRRALVTGGDLKLNGNPNIMGLCGGAHSNDDMQISGNPGIQMDQGLTASNLPGGVGSLPEGMDISGNPCVGSSNCNLPSGQQPAANQIDTNAEKNAYEAANSSAAPETIPKINPAEYAPLVAALGETGPAGPGYILHDDCTVTTGATCETNGLCTGGAPVAAIPAGWSCSGSTWKVAGGGTAADGVFYAEGKVEVSGNPGSAAIPWQVTIIARDDIKIAGNPVLQPYPTTSTGLQNTLLVTGNDLEISGNPDADNAVGAILVHQQVKISGNPEIKGFIISGDGQPTWTGDPFPPSVASSGVTLNEISGSVNITYQCDIGCSGPGCPPPTIVLLTWREVF